MFIVLKIFLRLVIILLCLRRSPHTPLVFPPIRRRPYILPRPFRVTTVQYTRIHAQQRVTYFTSSNRVVRGYLPLPTPAAVTVPATPRPRSRLLRRALRIDLADARRHYPRKSVSGLSRPVECYTAPYDIIDSIGPPRDRRGVVVDTIIVNFFSFKHDILNLTKKLTLRRYRY